MDSAPIEEGKLAEEVFHNDENGRKFGLEVLACIRKSNAFEKIPKAIDKLIKEINIYNESNHPQYSAFKNAFEKVKHLQHEIFIQLEKIQNKKWYSPLVDFVRSCNPVPEMPPSHTSSAVSNRIAFNTMDTNEFVNRQTDVFQVESNPERSIATQPSNFVLSTGESFQCPQLVRSAYTNLEQLTIFFCPVWRAADEVDKIVKGAFGLHFYSEEFRQLCILWATADKILDKNSCNYQPFREIVETLTHAEHKNNLYEISLNLEIMDSLKKLDAVLNNEFYELCAIMYASKLFSIYPANCKGIEQKYCLECIQHACNVLINVSDNRDYNGAFSQDIKNGIVQLQNEYIKLQIFCN